MKNTNTRSEQARATWAGRTPKYEQQRCITLRPAVFDALNDQRAGRSWAEYLCAVAGIEPPRDRRFKIRVTEKTSGNAFTETRPDEASAKAYADFVNAAGGSVVAKVVVLTKDGRRTRI